MHRAVPNAPPHHDPAVLATDRCKTQHANPESGRLPHHHIGPQPARSHVRSQPPRVIKGVFMQPDGVARRPIGSSWTTLFKAPRVRTDSHVQ